MPNSMLIGFPTVAPSVGVMKNTSAPSTDAVRVTAGACTGAVSAGALLTGSADSTALSAGLSVQAANTIGNAIINRYGFKVRSFRQADSKATKKAPTIVSVAPVR